MSSSASQLTSLKLAWILRIGVAGCFIGHGAFGIITKAAWVPYFAVGGISEALAWKLMPVVGAMDIGIGLLALVWPTRALYAWAAIWAVWTALCRPLAHEPFWETLERAGNYGVPIALLVAFGFHAPWFRRLPASWPTFSDLKRTQFAWSLRLTTATLLAGHAGLGFFTLKAGLAHHYSAAWADAPANTVVIVGAFEFALATAVLLRPVPSLLVGVALWKMASESLFLVAGDPVWEFIERAGSYTAPLALAVLLAKTRRNNLSSFSPAAA